MATKLIELADGILVEVEVEAGAARQISGGAAERVQSSLAQIEPLILAVSKTISSTWKQMHENLEIEKATVELGLSFEGSGNIFITQAKAGANLTVTLELKPKDQTTGAK